MQINHQLATPKIGPRTMITLFWGFFGWPFSLRHNHLNRKRAKNYNG
ncbi:hypothetical protein HMPREF9103_00189 [Lentilactobacillus parafarraginis F0439]|uniref:Uncharacterized protein n=1 Tax=Lentilactobacillus parafarraginis F0439 TaxID=797515 RepID=G9ZKE1_9LACO|nr:hypothetical protein HMPREF9103_00189 [Lentilactobacillus parafarraginis F0439]